MNTLVFCLDKYENECKMWNDIKETLRILTYNGYIIKFYCDEPSLGIYCIQYDTTPELSGRELVLEEIE